MRAYAKGSGYELHWFKQRSLSGMPAGYIGHCVGRLHHGGRGGPRPYELRISRSYTRLGHFNLDKGDLLTGTRLDMSHTPMEPAKKRPS
jgi:hypothetical protein